MTKRNKTYKIFSCQEIKKQKQKKILMIYADGIQYIHIYALNVIYKTKYFML